MTDANEKRVVNQNEHRTVWHDEATERYGTDEDFVRSYDASTEELVFTHVASGDEVRVSPNGGTVFTIHDAAPSDPSEGEVVLQDGTNWDPAGSAAVELVAYDGSAWVSA